MRTIAVLATLLLAVATAGCTEQGPEDTPGTDAPPQGPAPGAATAPNGTLVEVPFEWGVGVGVPVTNGYFHALQDGDQNTLDLDAAATVAFEATWTCTAGPCEIAIVLEDDAGAVVEETAGTSPLVLELPLDAGAYDVLLTDRSPNQGVSGTLTVTA